MDQEHATPDALAQSLIEAVAAARDRAHEDPFGNPVLLVALATALGTIGSGTLADRMGRRFPLIVSPWVFSQSKEMAVAVTGSPACTTMYGRDVVNAPAALTVIPVSALPSPKTLMLCPASCVAPLKLLTALPHEVDAVTCAQEGTVR